MSPFQHQRPHDRRVTSIGGGLNERFSRLEKPAPITKTVTTNVQAQTSTSVFSRIKGGSSTQLSTMKKRGTSSGIQSRIGRVSGGSIQKRVGKAQNISPRKLASTSGVGGNLNRAKQSAKLKAMSPMNGMKGSRNIDPKSKQKKSKTTSSTATEKGKKKALSADDLDKALDSYMMKDPKTAQARLNDELDSYMDEAGDVLMDL